MKLSDCAETGGETYGLLLYALAESVKATRVLEIGAGWGHSAVAFTESMRNRPGSSLISIDPHDRRRDDCKALVENTAVSWIFVEKLSSEFQPDGLFDIVYIDGDPRLAKADFDKFAPFVRIGGLVILDGYGGQPGPTDTVDALCKTLPFTLLPYHDVYSFAVHSTPRLPLLEGDYSARCETCGETSVQHSWSHIDLWADTHVTRALHTVSVYAAPRRLKYRKGPRV